MMPYKSNITIIIIIVNAEEH